MKVLEIYTDGSCDNVKSKAGGYAFIYKTFGDEFIYGFGNEINTTSNRMELLAVIKALETLENKNLDRISDLSIIIYTDSMYVLNSMEKWIHAWYQKGFVGIKNEDLMKELYSHVKKFDNINFKHVKAHAGGIYPFNDWVDEKAREQMMIAKNTR